jgi:hypothetical protein
MPNVRGMRTASGFCATVPCIFLHREGLYKGKLSHDDGHQGNKWAAHPNDNVCGDPGHTYHRLQGTLFYSGTAFAVHDHCREMQITSSQIR